MILSRLLKFSNVNHRSIDWLFFLILDLGNVVLDALPVGARVVDGLMQAIAVRAAGFGIVPLAALAPAVKYGPHPHAHGSGLMTVLLGFSM
jgi:Trk-type K+ transport system membrane component